MDQNLTNCRDGRQQKDDTIWTPCRICVNLFLFLVLLLGMYLLFYWESIRWNGHEWTSGLVLWPSNVRFTSQDRSQDLTLPVTLATALVVMVSLLHVVFKVPVFEFKCTRHTRRVPDTRIGDIGPKDLKPISEWNDFKEELDFIPRASPVSDQTFDEPGRINDKTGNGDDACNKPQSNVEEKARFGDSRNPVADQPCVSDMDQCVKDGQDIDRILSCQGDSLSQTCQILHQRDEPDVVPTKCPVETECLTTKRDSVTQTEHFEKPCSLTVGTMTLSPLLVDAAVNTQQKSYKIVKSCGTITSGPFMKKLRRAQRLLKEARSKTQRDKSDKLVKWKTILARYKDKLNALSQTLEKKDRLMGYTTINRALSENEIKDMTTAVRCHTSARDRLNTQCKLNSALREVIESKSDSGTSTGRPASKQASERN